MTDTQTKTVRHGKPSSYTNGGCRCDRCRKAMRDYMRDYYQRNPEKRKLDLSRRKLVYVHCCRCEWSGRRDARNGFAGVTTTPCPWCGSEVA